MKKVKEPKPAKAKRNVSVGQLIFEIIWYTICGGVALWGLTYITLGIIIDYLPIKDADDGLVKFQQEQFIKYFKLDFFGWGLIILAIAAVAAVIVLLLCSNKVDRDYEKNVRRAQRMAQLDAEVEKEELAEQDVVDAEVEPVKEEKPEQPEEKEPTPEAEPVEEKPAEEEKKEEPKQEEKAAE